MCKQKDFEELKCMTSLQEESLTWQLCRKTISLQTFRFRGTITKKIRCITLYLLIHLPPLNKRLQRPKAWTYCKKNKVQSKMIILLWSFCSDVTTFKQRPSVSPSLRDLKTKVRFTNNFKIMKEAAAIRKGVTLKLCVKIVSPILNL